MIRRFCIGAVILLAHSVVRAEAPEKLLRDAKRLFGLSDYGGALKLLGALVAKEPPAAVLVQAEIYRGLCFVRLAKKGEAREAFRRVLALDPEAGPDKRRVGDEAFSVFEEARATMFGGLHVTVGPRSDVFVCVDGRRRPKIGWFNDNRVTVGRRKVGPCDRDGRPMGDAVEVVVRAGKTANVSLNVPMPQAAKVRVGSTPAGASIEIGGRATGLVTREAESVDIEVKPGEQVEVVLRLDGYADARIPVVVGAGQSLDVRRTLEKRVVAVEVKPVGPKQPTTDVKPKGGAPAGAATVKPGAGVRAAFVKVRSPLTTWAFVASGVSVATLTVGIVLAALGKKVESELNVYVDCFKVGSPATCATWSRSEYQSRYSTASSRLTAANVMFALSGVSAVGSGVLFYLGHRRSAARPVAGPALRVSPTSATLEFAF